jgi:uncharacterized membrane protein
MTGASSTPDKALSMWLSPLLSAPIMVQIHAFSAIAALLLGAVVLFRRKGTRLHKLLGRIWAALMLVVATSAIFINEIGMLGPFSPIHVFVVLTYFGLAQGIWHIRRGEVQAHRAAMQTLYFMALALTGSFTLLPGRRMHAVLFGADAGWAPSLIAMSVAIVASGWLWWRLSPKRSRQAAS